VDLIDKMCQPAAVSDIKIEWQNMNVEWVLFIWFDLITLRLLDRY
jgi:hypothetical protein